jgi:hypothetical protein
MKPEQVVFAERLAWLIGFVAIVVAIGAFDWRLGLLVAGLMVFGSTIDWKRP